MFTVGKPVVGSDFLDRSQMLKKLRQNISNKQNVMIKAPRRYGKTSLAKEAFRLQKQNYLYIDYRRSPRADLIAEKIIDYAYALVGIEGFIKNATQNVMSFFKEHSKSLKIKLSIFEYTLEFLGEEKSATEKLIYAIELVESIAKDLNTTVYIVHDEFQDITKLNTQKENILELLRSTIQHQEFTCHYFLGSNETMMTEIFEDKKSPLYRFCRIFDLDAFDIDEVTKQLLKKFRSKQIVFERDEIMHSLLLKLHGHPANTIIVMQILYYMSLEKDLKMMTQKDLNKAYSEGYEENSDYLGQLIIDIKSKKHQHDVMYRLAAQEPQQLKGQALNQVLKSLTLQGYLHNKERGVYSIIDGFLKEHLLLQ